MLRVENLTKSFGHNVVLKDVNLHVKKGEVVVIIGESGCGKSVFLRCVELLEKPDCGRVFIDNEEITSRKSNINKIRQNIGMVYQQYNLFEHLDVMDNLLLAPLKLLKMKRSEAEQKALQLLKEIGLSGREHKMPSELSGGQKQRIAIARCLMMNPKLILMDEPTSALDPGMVSEVLATIRALAKKRTTMIIVTHEFNFAREIADRIIFLSEKGVYEEGTPDEIFNKPKKDRTKAFIHKVRSMVYHVDRADFDLMELQGKIYSFCERYGVRLLETWRLSISLEEMLREIVKRCRSPVDITLCIDYNTSDSRLDVKSEWFGPDWNPLIEDSEELGIVILQHIIVNEQYSYIDGMCVLNFSIRKEKV